jgi:catechol 1,2-dioxygenase
MEILKKKFPRLGAQERPCCTDEVLPQELQHRPSITRSTLSAPRLSLAMKRAMDERKSNRETGIADALTEKVLQAYSEIDNVRLRGLVACLIRHLHAFVKEAKPTDKEFETAWTLMAEMAKFTGAERNEFLLLFDVTGVSELVEKINHVRPQSAVGFSLVGPFYRANAPIRERGETIASDDTKGDRVRVTGRVSDVTTGSPLAGATLDVWQAATNGLYENQDKGQPEYNLRGRFQADESGTFELMALLPTPYPVPVDGPVGELIKVAKRQPYRPAHIHFIVSAPKYETLVTQVFRKGDDIIDKDPVFAAEDDCIGEFRRENGQYSLHYDFQLRPGISTMPKAPIP